jgi:hypothetical protein
MLVEPTNVCPAACMDSAPSPHLQVLDELHSHDTSNHLDSRYRRYVYLVGCADNSPKEHVMSAFLAR